MVEEPGTMMVRAGTGVWDYACWRVWDYGAMNADHF